MRLSACRSRWTQQHHEQGGGRSSRPARCVVDEAARGAAHAFTPKFGTGELGSELAELVGEEGVDARPSRIEALRVAGRPGTPEVACA